MSNNLARNNSVECLEEKAKEALFNEIKYHLDYSTKIYNLSFKLQSLIDGKSISEVSKTIRSLFMILFKMNDFLRSIQHLSVIGYPEQAGALCASIFELAHTSVYFSFDSGAAEKWLSATSIDDEMPRKLINKDWYGIVKSNIKNCGLDNECSENEYRVYKQLCWMKHSHPMMQDMIVKNSSELTFMMGPYTDERAINHIWFSIEHAGRLIEMVMSRILTLYEAKNGTVNQNLKDELDQCSGKRNSLQEMAIKRFGRDDPFNQTST